MTTAREQNSAVELLLWLINDMKLITTKGWGWVKGGSICWYSDHWNEDSNTDRLIHTISLPCTCMLYEYMIKLLPYSIDLIWHKAVNYIAPKLPGVTCVSVGSNSTHSCFKMTSILTDPGLNSSRYNFMLKQLRLRQFHRSATLTEDWTFQNHIRNRKTYKKPFAITHLILVIRQPSEAEAVSSLHACELNPWKQFDNKVLYSSRALNCISQTEKNFIFQRRLWHS